MRSDSTLRDWLRSPCANFLWIKSTNVVFVRRSLKPAEIEMLRLRRGEVVECSVSNDTVQSIATINLGKAPVSTVFGIVNGGILTSKGVANVTVCRPQAIELQYFVFGVVER